MKTNIQERAPFRITLWAIVFTAVNAYKWQQLAKYLYFNPLQWDRSFTVASILLTKGFFLALFTICMYLTWHHYFKKNYAKCKFYATLPTICSLIGSAIFLTLIILTVIGYF